VLCRPADTRGFDTLTGIVPFATFTFDFDPLLHLGDNGVRYETLGIAGAVFFALVFAALAAGRTPLDGRLGPAWVHTDDTHLRRDDLLFIVLGIVPGAVIGGRIGYVLLHLDYYGANVGSIWDPSQGSLELGLAVVGGILTGAYVARLLDAPVGPWLHAAAGPAFLAITLGELARVLGGSGQGAPAGDGWTTAYLGAGPWGSLAPAVPAHPAQVYGAIAAFIALVAVAAVRRAGGFSAQDGSSFFVAVLIWAIGRTVVTTTWRDEPVLGPLPAGGVIALGVVAFAVAGIGVARWSAARERNQAHGLGSGPAQPAVVLPDPVAAHPAPSDPAPAHPAPPDLAEPAPETAPPD
jgi:prolipoprotein diacylglyceryltransferase